MKLITCLLAIVLLPMHINAKTVTIMPLGDSITQSSPGYRQALYKLLKDGGIDFNFVGSMKGSATDWQDVCEGHGGFTIGPGASMADNWTDGKGNILVNLDNWLGAVKPDYIILYLGVNDFCNIGDRQKDYNPDQQAAGRLGGVLDKIHELSPSTKILYASLSSRWPDNYKNYNKSLPDLAKTRDYATFVDMANKAGFDNDDWDPSVVHPKPSGDQKMAQVWFDALKAQLNPYGLK